MSKNANIDGIGSITSGEYDSVSIGGIGKIKGKVSCNKLVTDGMLKGKGKISAVNFECNGISRMFRDIKCKAVTINGILKLRRANLESDLINCDGIIVCNREISSDEIHIDGICSVAKMYGDKIIIRNRANGIAESKIPYKILPFIRAYLGRKVSLSHSIVDILECTELNAENLIAKSVKAHNITLGENCIIDRLDCTGELKYHNSCRFRRISCKNINPSSENLNIEIQNTDIISDNISVTKTIDLYKKGILTANEADQMIKSITKK